MSYLKDRLYADSFHPEISRVLKKCAHKIISIEIASDDLDKTQATDYEIKIVGGTIAARVRRDCRFYDLTIRASRPNGLKTELEKLRHGYGDWYLYAWARGNRFEDWMLVCLKTLRQKGLLDSPKRMQNPDGTTFLPIHISALHKHKCIKAASGGIQAKLGLQVAR